MNRVIQIILLFVCIYSFDVYAQSNQTNRPAKATVILDSSNKTSIRGQASIAFLKGRNFKRPENQFQKSLTNIREQMNNTTGLFISEYAKMPLASKQLLEIPFAILAAGESFNLSVDEMDNISKYLKNGGFIYCENIVGTMHNSPVEQSFRKMIEESLNNEASLYELTSTHPLFHCFYDFNSGAPVIRQDSIINRSPLYAVEYDSRIVALYSNRPYTVEWNRLEKNTLSLKFAVNMIIFAVTRDGANTVRK